jgi:hypothetical protein
MRKLLALFVLMAACVHAQETVDLGSRGRLTFYLLGDWEVTTTSIANNLTVTISPTKEQINASCTLGISFPTTDRYDTKSRLKLRVEADGLPYVEQSVEGRAVAKEFMLSSGYGYYCSFTDPELRGKPPQKGNYKVISVGKIRFAPDVLIDVGISADAFNGEPYQQLRGAIEGMEFSPARGR